MSGTPVNEYDRCPACRKKLVNVLKEGGKFLQASCGAMVCPKCGCHFFPKSMIDAVIKQANSPIILPTQNNTKLVKP